MQYLVGLLLTIMFFYSCNEGQKEVSNYNNSGKVESIKYFHNETDTMNYYVKYFRDNGTVKCEGQKTQGQKSGKWNTITINN
ncbi:hypothetical protein BH11BAC1_BH11BAC1_08970 [soil metagenome]